MKIIIIVVTETKRVVLNPTNLRLFLVYLTDPCPLENIWVEEPVAGNCSVVWEDVPLVEHYMAFIKRDDGMEKSCNTTGTTCSFPCLCGYSYLTTVFPYNQAGSSPYAQVRNYTTSRTRSTHLQYHRK